MEPEPPTLERNALSAPLLLVEEIGHRVINEYAEAISSLNLAARGADRRAQAAIASAADRLRLHAAAHRALLPPSTSEPLNLADHLGDVCGAAATAYLAEHEVRVSLWSDDLWAPPDVAWRIGLIVAELVRNAWRHGLARGSGAIVVRVSSRGESISCIVADSGRGDRARPPGRGTHVVRALAAALGGTVEWSFSREGSLVRVDVPRAPAGNAAALEQSLSIE